MAHELSASSGDIKPGKEVLFATVVDGKEMSYDQAAEMARSTGENIIGEFNTPEEATAYAKQRSAAVEVAPEQDATEEKVVRKVRLPSGEVKKFRFPKSWGKEEIRAAMDEKGYLGTTAPKAKEPKVTTRGQRKKEAGGFTTRPTEPEGMSFVGSLIKGLEFIDRPRAAIVSAIKERYERGEEAQVLEAVEAGIRGEQHPLMGDIVFDVLMKARRNPEEHPEIAAMQKIMGLRVQTKMPTSADWGITEVVDDEPARVDAAIATMGGLIMDIMLDPVTYTGIGLTSKGTAAQIKSSLAKEGKEITDPALAKKLDKLEAKGDMQEYKKTLHERLAAGQERVKIAAVPVPAAVSAPIAKATHDFIKTVKSTQLGQSTAKAFSTKAGLEEGLEEFVHLETRLNNIVAMGKNDTVKESAQFSKDIRTLADDITAETGTLVKPDDLNRIIVEEVERAKMSSFVNDVPVEDVVHGPSRLRRAVNKFTKVLPAKARDFVRPEAMSDEVKSLIVTHPQIQSWVKSLKDKNLKQFQDEVAAGVQISKLGSLNPRKLDEVDEALAAAQEAGVTQIKSPITGRKISVEGLHKQAEALRKEVDKASQLDYFVHAATPEAVSLMKQNAKKQTGKFSARKYSLQHASTLQRRWAGMSVAEINDLAAKGKLPGFEGQKIKQFFYDDPALAQALRDMRHNRSMAVAEMFSGAKAQFGRSTDELRQEAIKAGAKKSISVEEALPEGWAVVKNPKAAQMLRGHAFPEEIARRLDEHYERLLDPADTSKFLEIYDSVQNWWKAWTLSIFPAYHVRNAVGNVWNNYVTGTTDPTVYAAAFKLQQGSEGAVKTVDGRRITFDEIRQHVNELGIHNRGFIGTDVETAVRAEVGKAKWATLSRDSKAIYYGRKVGSSIENNARIAKYIDELQKGKGFVDAAEATKKALFDYSDLTKFEKSVAKRLAPFYTWSRKNIPLQVEMMVRSPGKFKAIDTLRQEIEANTDDPGEYVLADWMLDNYPMRVKIDETDSKPRYWMAGGWLPAADVWRFAANPAQMAIDMMSPIIKTVGEFLTNKDWRTYNDIKSYESETVSILGDSYDVSPRMKKLLSNLRVFTTIDSMLPSAYTGLLPQTIRDQTPEERFLALMTGLKLYGVDMFQQKMFSAKETEDRIKELGWDYAKAATKQRPQQELEGLSDEIKREVHRLEKIMRTGKPGREYIQ